MPARDPAIRVLMMPKDTNGYGTIFGGVILSHIDLASDGIPVPVRA
jgi:acyl-CoA thioesterase YciA